MNNNFRTHLKHTKIFSSSIFPNLKLLSYVRSIQLLLSIVFFSCSDKKDPKLEEAAKLHNEATEIQAAIEPQIEGADSLITVLNEKKKTSIF